MDLFLTCFKQSWSGFLYLLMRYFPPVCLLFLVFRVNQVHLWVLALVESMLLLTKNPRIGQLGLTRMSLFAVGAGISQPCWNHPSVLAAKFKFLLVLFLLPKRCLEFMSAWLCWSHQAEENTPLTSHFLGLSTESNNLQRKFILHSIPLRGVGRKEYWSKEGREGREENRVAERTWNGIRLGFSSHF